MQLCIQEPSASAVCDLNLTQLNMDASNLAQIMTCATPAATPFKCSLPALAPVSFPGLGN
jgi:hypothetical protein